MRGLPFRRSVVSLMGASLLMSATAPASLAHTRWRGGHPGDSVLELYSNDGRLVHRYQASEISAPRRPLIKQANAASGSSRAEAAAKLRAAVSRMKQSNSNHKPDLSLSLVVADAMSATSEAEAHRILATLPVRIERTVSSGSDALFVTTSVFVRGTLKFRMIQPVASGGIDEQSSASDHVAESSTPFDSETAFSDASHGPSLRATALECDTDPDDPCADQQDRDDALAAAASMQSDLDAANAAEASDESDCYAAQQCWATLEESTSLSSGSAASPSFEAAPALGDELSTAFGNNLFASVSADLLFNCWVEYTAAAGGILWGASGVAGLVAAAGSPDPISKLALFSLWTNAAAGVAAAVTGVAVAYNCWAQ